MPSIWLKINSIIIFSKVNPETSAWPEFLGFLLRSFMSHSVHTQIWKLHLVDWDRLVLGVPRSNSQRSRWTGRRTVRKERGSVNRSVEKLFTPHSIPITTCQQQGKVLPSPGPVWRSCGPAARGHGAKIPVELSCFQVWIRHSPLNIYNFNNWITSYPFM